MKTIGKKTLAWLLSILLMAGCCLTAGLPKLTVSAETVDSGSCGDNVIWTLEGDTLTISGTGDMEDYAYYFDVPWYSYRLQILSVVIEEGITGIGEYAFYNCENLTEITIPEGITSIGGHAFLWCENLTELNLPDSLTSIGEYAVRACDSLTEIFIPDSLTSIGKYNFDSCESLMTILVSEDNPVYSSQDGVLFNKEKSELIVCPAGKAGSYTVPESVVSIGAFAFYECGNLTEIILPSGITSIGEYTFSGCRSLTEFIIPDSVISIGDSAFSYCTSLTEITIPDNVTSIENYAFTWCIGLTKVNFSNSITSIEDGIFAYCYNLVEVTLPDTITSIGSSSFLGCSSLSEITIPDSVTSIRDDAFSVCESLAEIIISDSVTSIGSSAFYGCSSLTDVYYSGSEEQWNAISIGDDNEYLTNAAIHYNSTGPEKDDDDTIIDLPFTDTQDPDTYFYEAVQYVYSLGLMTGLDSTTFGPGETLSRAHFATILYRLAGSPSVEGMSNPFEDNQSSDTFFYNAVIWCNNVGVITGYYNADGSFSGRFGPSDSITREQLATMLYRYANYVGEDTSASVSLDSFGDAASVSSFAAEALQWAAAEGIVSGRQTTPPTIAPQDNASRADAAVMLQRYLV